MVQKVVASTECRSTDPGQHSFSIPAGKSISCFSCVFGFLSSRIRSRMYSLSPNSFTVSGSEIFMLYRNLNMTIKASSGNPCHRRNNPYGNRF